MLVEQFKTFWVAYKVSVHYDLGGGRDFICLFIDFITDATAQVPTTGRCSLNRKQEEMFCLVSDVRGKPQLGRPRYSAENPINMQGPGSAMGFTGLILGEAMKAIASMPPGHCLDALENLQQKFTIFSQGALYRGENALVPLPLQIRNRKVWIQTNQGRFTEVKGRERNHCPRLKLIPFLIFFKHQIPQSADNKN